MQISSNTDNFRRVFGDGDLLDVVAKTPTNNLSRNLEHYRHEQRGRLICAARSSEGAGRVGAVGQGRAGQAGPGGQGVNGGAGGPGGHGRNGGLDLAGRVVSGMTGRYRLVQAGWGGVGAGSGPVGAGLGRLEAQGLSGMGLDGSIGSFLL